MSIENNIIELGKRAKSASLNMKVCSSDQKNLALIDLDTIFYNLPGAVNSFLGKSSQLLKIC